MPPEPIKKTLDIRREVRRCPECARRFSRDAVFCPYDGARLELGMFDPDGDPLLGQVIDGRYEVLEILGEGGMGRVYRVRHRTLGREFALKALRRDMASDTDLAARFVQEAKTAASVRHPHIVPISDFGRLSDGLPYFVMELCIGHSLGEIIKAGGPIPAGRAVLVAKQIAAALGAAHDAGIVHRDLKPENVFLVGGSPTEPADVGRARAMLGERVDVRVVDFGAAKVMGSSRMTRTGIVFGTPHYMSPEQASGAPLDHRADVYALGIILYEMFTGRVPFEADTYMGVLTQHMFVAPVPPSQVSSAARELGALEAVTLRCLEKRPENRYATMQDVIAAIDAATRQNEGLEVTVASRPSRGPRLSPRPVADALEPPTREEARARRRGAVSPVARNAALVALAMVAVSAALTAWWRGRAVEGATAATPASTPAPAPAAPGPVLAPRPAPAAGPDRAPDPAAAGPVSPPADSVGSATASAARPVTRRPPVRRNVPAAMDDVGDPFAAPPARGGAR